MQTTVPDIVVSKASIRRLLIVGAILLCPQDVAAIRLDSIDCIPEAENGNAVITAHIEEIDVGSWPNLYFRAYGSSDFYYVQMQAEVGKLFWAVLPKPEPKTESVEYYASIVGPTGEKSFKSQLEMANVTDSCRQQLSARQFGNASNITVGETTPNQTREKVLGFECDGIVIRIDWRNIMYPDEVCRERCVIAWRNKKSILIPGAAGGIAAGLITLIIAPDERPEASPVIPNAEVGDQQ